MSKLGDTYTVDGKEFIRTNINSHVFKAADGEEKEIRSCRFAKALPTRLAYNEEFNAVVDVDGEEHCHAIIFTVGHFRSELDKKCLREFVEEIIRVYNEAKKS